VTFLGTAAADSLAGTSAAERFVSAQGNDTLTGGGGADVFNAGAGNDLIRASNLAFAEIDGGSGTDTLVMLGAGRTLNLVARPDNEIVGIERISLTGTGFNHLVLSDVDLFALSDTSNHLRVDGNTGDTVSLDGSWIAGAIAGGYQTYTLGAATIQIDVDVDIFVT
jgi:hypothetical protein